MNEPKPPGAPADIDPEKLKAATTGMLHAYWAARQPDTPAIITHDRTVTFAELNARANQLARAFRARGLERGDGVALMSANHSEFAEVLAATRRAGLRLTTVNWHLTPEEAAYIVDDCDAKAFVVDARFERRNDGRDLVVLQDVLQRLGRHHQDVHRT